MMFKLNHIEVQDLTPIHGLYELEDHLQLGTARTSVYRLACASPQPTTTLYSEGISSNPPS